MKSVMYFIGLATLAGSCNLMPTTEGTENDSVRSASSQSSSILEGEWTWLGTRSVGIAGPHVSDSISAGYSWKLVFYHSNGMEGSLLYLKYYKNGQGEECLGNYSYKVDKDSQELNYSCNSWLNNNRWESYRWEIEIVGDKSHLYLRNIEDCCDDSFEHHFLLTK